MITFSSLLNKRVFYLRPEMKFCFVTKKNLLALLFIAGKIKWNLVTGVVVMKQPKSEQDTETSIFYHILDKFHVKLT